MIITRKIQKWLQAMCVHVHTFQFFMEF
jgi:hypothetical protein